LAPFLDSFAKDKGGGSRMLKVRAIGISLAAATLMLTACRTLEGKPDHVLGVWGGPHAGVTFQGGLADVVFDCATATIDEPLYAVEGGPFSIKGTYRTGPPGPVKVGEFFKSQSAVFAGEVTKSGSKGSPQQMTFHVTLEDGTNLGPFTVSDGTPPQLTPCR
jgi:hypothetical protein